MPTIDFWCELASPYAFLSASRVDALAARAGIDVQWRPFLLHPIFRAAGWTTSPFLVYRDKGRYMWRDVEREADRLNIPFQKPTDFPRNSVPASKIAVFGMKRGWGARFIQRAMRANFVEDRDIASPEVLASMLLELHLDSAAIFEEATSPENAQELRCSTEEAMRLRIFGAPTFIVGEEMFWGNDRLESALAWAARAPSAAASG